MVRDFIPHYRDKDIHKDGESVGITEPEDTCFYFMDSVEEGTVAYLRYEQDGRGGEFISLDREDLERIYAWTGKRLKNPAKG